MGDAVGGTGSKKGVLTAAFAVGTDKDWSSGITTVASNIYDFDQDLLQKAVWKLCLYSSQEKRVYTVDVVSINVCALSIDNRHGGHDNLVFGHARAVVMRMRRTWVSAGTV